MRWRHAIAVGFFEGAGSISGQHMAETILTRTRGCYCCPIHCTRIINVPHGPYFGTAGKAGLPATVAFGSQCGNDNIEAIARLMSGATSTALTGHYGTTIAWAMELFERGIIDRNDTWGLDLRFGNQGRWWH